MRTLPNATGHFGLSEQRLIQRMIRFATGLTKAFQWPTDMIRSFLGNGMIYRCKGIAAPRPMAFAPGSVCGKASDLGRDLGRKAFLANRCSKSVLMDLSFSEFPMHNDRPTLIPGDGIGADMTDATMDVLNAAAKDRFTLETAMLS